MQADSTQNVFGFAHLWASGDTVSHGVAILLVLMSIVSWYIILVKMLEGWKLRRAGRLVPDFWAARSLDEGLEQLRKKDADNPYALLATQAGSCHSDCATAGGQLSAHFDFSEQMERTLRQQLSASQAGMENG